MGVAASSVSDPAEPLPEVDGPLTYRARIWPLVRRARTAFMILRFAALWRGRAASRP